MTWLLLVLSLPTENATARMRAWRALKSSGAAVLRDGVHLLPDEDRHAQTLAAIADDLRASGGTAHLLRTDDTAPDYRALFDRSAEFATLLADLHTARTALKADTAGDTTQVSSSPALSLTKSDGGVSTTPGGTLLYTLDYANAGHIGLAGVTLQETVPANTTFDATGSTPGWSCADASPAGTACTLTIGNLAGGASGTATFAVTVAGAVPAGVTQIANSATVASSALIWDSRG